MYLAHRKHSVNIVCAIDLQSYFWKERGSCQPKAPRARSHPLRGSRGEVFMLKIVRGGFTYLVGELHAKCLQER